MSIKNLKYLSEFKHLSYLLTEDCICDDVGLVAIKFSNNGFLSFRDDEELYSVITSYCHSDEIEDFGISSSENSYFNYRISAREIQTKFLQDLIDKRIKGIQVCRWKHLKESIRHRANEHAICFDLSDDTKAIFGFSIDGKPKRIFEPESYNLLEKI
ncbi:MAG: hypothetical protein ACOYOA_16430 [Saprospiraceae bacterium]